MEQKLVRVPFEVELAKKITNGEVEGKIVTRNNRKARIVCFDVKDKKCPIIGLVSGEFNEIPNLYSSDGKFAMKGESDSDLMLEIPEYMTFKDGDVATLGWKSDDGEFCEWITILKSVEADEINILTEDYVTVCLKCDEENYFPVDFNCTSDRAKWIRKPTEPEKQKLINALKESKEPKAKECLKILGIEVKAEFEFTFRQVVLVRWCDGGIWSAAEFSHKNGDYFYIFGGLAYKNCIPYNDQTKHLLGTTENWEE